MGKVGKENGVLKLVRPGGVVELYNSPIKAAQVMEKYPRHCVTRPDVFKFPYIVVKPESILKPGRVFFIVPKHTIHRLLQSKGYKTLRQMEEIDTSFFQQIVSVEDLQNKKQSNHDQLKVIPRRVEDYDSDEAYSAALGCFPNSRKKGGGAVETSATGLKPCLKRHQKKKTRSQQGPRVRFTLPSEDDNKENCDTDISDF